MDAATDITTSTNTSAKLSIDTALIALLRGFIKSRYDTAFKEYQLDKADYTAELSRYYNIPNKWCVEHCGR